MPALYLGGCGCPLNAKEPIAYNVTVSLDEGLRKDLASRKVEVHLIGINEKQNERWANYSMTKYWQPGDTLSGSVPTKKMIFDPANSAPQTLKANDPIWDTWLKAGANRLYVLTLLPGMVSDADGDKDPRRQIEPLACYRWTKRDHNIEIRIQSSGMTTVSQLRQEH
jgi:hypothetical protein